MMVYEITVTVRLLMILGIVAYFTFFIAVEASKKAEKNEIKKDILLLVSCFIMAIIDTIIVMKFKIREKRDMPILIGNYVLLIVLTVKSVLFFKKLKK